MTDELKQQAIAEIEDRINDIGDIIQLKADAISGWQDGYAIHRQELDILKLRKERKELIELKAKLPAIPITPHPTPEATLLARIFANNKAVVVGPDLNDAELALVRALKGEQP